MKKSKKLLSTGLISAALVAVLSIPALATTAYPKEGGTWNYGIVAPGNGYYMGYSYYYHASKAHRTSVTIGSSVYRSPDTAPGYTACVNSPSVQNYSNINCYYALI